MQKIKLLLCFIIITFTILPSIAQASFSVTLSTTNVSGDIKNGKAVSTVTGGKSPYTYFWSINSIDTLSSETSASLLEGCEHSLLVVDSNGDSVLTSFVIPAKSANEKINHFFHQIVSSIASVIMVDIFALFHIYDPVIYNASGVPLMYPNGTYQTMSIPLIVIWLVFGAFFFTFKMKFINFRGFKHAIQLIRGKFDKPGDIGQISHFQALTTALSATVGLGNIAGVAIAISLGGPGAVFWMILAGFLGMASKFTEATLGVKYRRIDKNGEVSGGPMYYLKYIFGRKPIGKYAGKSIAALFAVLLIGGSLGAGNMFQANQTVSQLLQVLQTHEENGILFHWFSVNRYIVGIILSVLVGVVIIGGIKSIANVTSKVVPFMAGIYLVAALVIIFINIDQVGNVISIIFKGAFIPDAIYGGFIGVLIMGFRRAAFSNEAGIGSAAIAHSAVKTDEPVSEGIVALLEPFIDTVVICTITAFVILFTGFYTPEATAGLGGAEITSKAFSSVIPWFDWILFIAIFLFAFSTMISWSYYGRKAFNYLFGGLSIKYFNTTQVSTTFYNVIFLVFVVVGSASSLDAVIDFADMMILGMAIPNIMGLIIFAPRIKRDLDKYLDKLKRGIIKKYS